MSIVRSTLLGAALWSHTCAAQQLRFQHLTTDEGLSDNAVTCIFEDKAGYIWIGTERGLNRYDGQRVEQFPPGRTGPMGIHITAIDEDGTGRIWVSTMDGGLSMRDPRTALFTHFRKKGDDPNALPSDLLNHVLVVNDTLVVLCSQDQGAIWFNTRRNTLSRAPLRQPAVNNDGDTTARSDEYWSHGAVWLDDHRLWLPIIPTHRSHIVDALTGVQRDTIQGGPSGFMPTNGLMMDGVLYAGGWKPGILRIPLDVMGPPEFLPLDDEVTAMVPWGVGHLLAATKLKGLVLLDASGQEEHRWRHVRSDHASLVDDRARCLLKDRSGNLWAGTADGLSVFAQAVWPFASTQLLGDGEAGDPVFHCLQQDPNGTIRIATSRGFFLLSPDDANVRNVPLRHTGVYLEPTGLFPASPGACFIGTETGFFRYDPVHERLVTANETRAFLSYGEQFTYQVRSIYLDTVDIGPQLIVGALGWAQYAYDPITGTYPEKWSAYPSTMKEPAMQRATVRDRHGTYWTATTVGIMRWVPPGAGASAEAVVYSMDGARGRILPGKDVTAITIRGDTVWAALRDAGLVRVVDGVVTAFTPPAHIPHDALGVAVDGAGHAWFTTSNGLVRLDPGANAWLHVPVNDGRDFRRLNSCILTLADGRIAFCADRHLITFDPRMFDKLPTLPTPELVELKNTWGAIAIPADGAVAIPYRNGAFDASITALMPTGARPLTFVYRLEGIDAAARVITAREPIRYAGVPVGTHRLLVRVRDAYGREGPEHALLMVKVTGPFWQRWWFFLLVLAAGALAMYLVSRLRQKQRMKLQGVRDRIARDLHDDIGSTLGSISFYSEALRRKLSTNGDGMTQDVAEKIGSSSREMIDRMSDIVWSVDPKHDAAGALIERLQAFARDLLTAKGITLDFRTDTDLKERKLSAEQRRNLFLICKEALYNTVKYAHARNVIIELSSEGRGLSIHITDDGRGFDPEKTDSYNGNGLVNMRMRATGIKARLSVESAPGNGTQVKLHLPAEMLVPRSGD